MVRGFHGTGVVLRLGGIYGPGRDRTVRRIAGGVARCPEPGRYGNRIHRDDAARAVRHLLTLDQPADLYLGVDRDPAPLREVYGWVAEQLGVPDPCQGTASEEPAPGRRVGPGRRSNKRCSSRRLEEAGFQFDYPTFRQGYADFIRAMSPGR